MEQAALVAQADRRKNMDFTLKDYQGNKRTFSLENPETVVTIIYTVLSADEVVMISRKGQEEKLEIYDSRKEDDRTSDFLDEIRILTLEELEKLNRE